jgi:hypothetical protein
MSKTYKALNGLLIGRSAYGIYNALTGPKTTPKRLIDLTFNLGTAMKAVGNIREDGQPVDELGREVVSSSDVLMTASAVLGVAFPDRKKMDFGEHWRDHLRGAVMQYMPPVHGLKAMMLGVIQDGPMRIDSQYTEEVQSLLAGYAFDTSGQAKAHAKRRIYEIAVSSAQNFGFHKKACFIEDEPVYANVFRITLEPGILEFDPEYEISETLTCPALFRPGSYGDMLVAPIPALMMPIKKGLEVEEEFLPTTFSEAVSTETIEIIYNWTQI